MFYDYWPFWMGGVEIALIAVILVMFSGKYLSMTRGYASLCSIFSKKSYFHRPDMGGPFGVRTFFVLGVALGGFLAAVTTNGYHPNWSLGTFDQIWGDSLVVKGGVLLFGGCLWGYGSRLARGCTAGHSISGLSRGSLASLASTVMFLVGGVIVAHLLAFLKGEL